MGAKVEEVLGLAGGFGRWHWGVLFLASIPGLFFSTSKLGMMFVGGIPDHWCSIPELKRANWTTEDIKKVAIPKDEQKGEGVFSQCEMYQRNYSALALMDPSDANSSEEGDFLTVSCNHWEYDYSVFSSSVVSDWELVCDRLHILATIHSAFTVGILLGSIMVGPLSDRYGRRTCAIIATAILMVVSIVNVFSVNYIMMSALRVVMGGCCFAVYVCCFALMVELCPNKKRSMITFVFDLFPGCGPLFVAALAYIIPDWRYLLLAYSLPTLSCIFFYWFLPESPRWLLVKGHIDETEKIIMRAAKRNKVPAPDVEVFHSLVEASKEEQEKDTKKATPTLCGLITAVTAFVKTKEMRKRSIPMFFCWFIISFVSYGLLFHFSKLPLNIYLLHSINGIVVTLTRLSIVVWPLPNLLGRRTCFLGCLVLGGVSGLIILAVPKDMEWLMVALSLACSAFVSHTFTLVYLYTAELFPTEVRNTSITTGSVFARFGGIAAPYIANYLYGFHYSVPSAVFGGCSALAAAACFLLPETYGKEMPETIAELEAGCKDIEMHDKKDENSHT